MAKNVTVVAFGGQPTVLNNANTVADVATEMSLGNDLQVKINDESATYDTELEDFAWVTFGEKVKGGR